MAACKSVENMGRMDARTGTHRQPETGWGAYRGGGPGRYGHLQAWMDRGPGRESGLRRLERPFGGFWPEPARGLQANLNRTAPCRREGLDLRSGCCAQPRANSGEFTAQSGLPPRLYWLLFKSWRR